MGRVAMIGEPGRVRGWELAGVLVLPAEGDDQVRERRGALPADVELVILTARAAAVPFGPVSGDLPLVVVLP